MYTNQAFTADVDENNLSGQLTLAYKATKNINAFATFSTSYKPIGVNLGDLPGISKWAGSFGGEITTVQSKALGLAGKFFLGFDTYFRSSFSSSPSPSQYLSVPGYALVNGRLGFRAATGLSFFVWGRNLLNRDYFEQLLPAAGNAGHYAGVLGDQRTYGITVRYSL